MLSDTLPSANSSFSSKTVGFDQESANLSETQLESEISITDSSRLCIWSWGFVATGVRGFLFGFCLSGFVCLGFFYLFLVTDC